MHQNQLRQGDAPRPDPVEFIMSGCRRTLLDDLWPKPLLPIEQELAYQCGKCDSDQSALCAKCPNRIPETAIINMIRDDCSGMNERDLAKRVLACRGIKKMSILAETLQHVVMCLGHIKGPYEINSHPLVMFLGHMIKNLSVPNPDFTMGRVQLMVEDLAGV